MYSETFDTYSLVWFGFFIFFNDMSTLVGYLMSTLIRNLYLSQMY